MNYKRVLKNLETKSKGKNITYRRYNLSEIISESYKCCYDSKKGSNLQRLAESHLEDVRNNPSDIDRLSRQLCNLKYVQKMVESKKMEDEELLVPKESHDSVEPKEERALDLEESSKVYKWGGWQSERGSSCRVRYYSSSMDITDQIIGVVYEKCEGNPYYGAEIYNNSTASTIEEKADDSHHFDTEEEAMEWVEEWFSKELLGESVHDEDVEETDDENLLDESDELTEEELDELARHLNEFRKNKKKDTDESDPITEAEHSGDRVCQYGIDIVVPDSADTETIKDKITTLLQAAGINVAGCMMSDTSWTKEEYGLVDESAKAKKDTSWDTLKEGMKNFSKASSSKAFYKTFKKLNGKLVEGKALTRQEAISLYKASNSAMTQLSVELEHNPEFLSTFKECTTILSKDVDSILGSLKEGKGPSKATMKSLAKFFEALLNEEDEEEELPPIEDEEFVVDEEGDIVSEEEEEFDQEYADARVELHKEIVDEHGETEDPGVQEKIAQDMEEIEELPGVTEEQLAELENQAMEVANDSAEEIEDEPTPEEDPVDEPEVVEEEPEEEDDDSEITDDELAELKRHLTEFRKARRANK